MAELDLTLFKGMRNDLGEKHVAPQYFYDVLNFNYDDLIGANKILMPSRINQLTSANVDGLIEYKYLNSSNILQTLYLGICDGNIYKNIFTTPVLIYSGLIPGLVNYVVFNDKLFIFNGKDYPLVYWGEKNIFYSMGAPATEESGAIGNPSGTYYYAVTYINTGGEEVVGTISNTITVTNKQIILNLPIGYDGTTQRNIYRTTASGNLLRLVANIANNTDTTYTDNIADASLGVIIPPVNNEMVKPYFCELLYNRMIGAVVDKYPTQAFVGDANLEIWDTASFVDVANYGLDNTPIRGIMQDYSQIIIGTDKNIIVLDASVSPVTVKYTRANVGVKNGYTMVRMPSFAGFDCGVMFLSTLNDIRVVSGNKDVIPNTINDISTDNWGQVVQGSLPQDVASSARFYAEFYDYKYHLLLDDIKYVFDIKNQGWSKHRIKSATYTSQPSVLVVINGKFYNGQIDGWIEQEYVDMQYRSEDVDAYLQTPQVFVNNNWFFLRDLIMWLYTSQNNTINVTVETNDDPGNEVSASFIVSGGAYDIDSFDYRYFDVNNQAEDYRMFHISRACKWAKIKIDCSRGRLLFRGYRLIAEDYANKEGIHNG